MKWLRPSLIAILLSLILFSIQPVNANPFPRLFRTTIKIPKHLPKNIPESVLKGFVSPAPDPNQVRLYLSRQSDNLYELSLSNGKKLLIDTEKKSLAQHLSSVVPEVQGKSQFFVPEDVFFENYETFSKLEKVDNLSVVRANTKVLSTQRLKTINGFERVIELRPHLPLGVKTSTEIDNAIWLMDRKFNSDDMRVISLFDPADDFDNITSTLTNVAGQLHIPLPQILDTSMAFTLRHSKNKIVFIVGHIEDNAFVVRRADGSVAAKFSIAQLEQEAQKSNVALVLLGCEATSVSKQSGFVTPVRGTVVAEGIAKALKAKNYGQMLSALATSETPLMVRSAIADQVRLIMEISAIQNSRAAAGRFLTLDRVSVRVSVRVIVRARVDPISPLVVDISSPKSCNGSNSRLIVYSKVNDADCSMTFKKWYDLYWVGMFFSIFTLRRSWRKFKEKWLSTSGFQLPGLLSSLYRTLGIAVFIFILPFYMALLFFGFLLLLGFDSFRAIALIFRKISYIVEYLWVKVSKLMHS
ncbi:hypothetical protein [Argonema antarcticum]|uniref:hypothetical protein n=1 Tax=Argonema antarcticum TaxID=2942763 RepID=UPI00201384BC|nr:hypothetical protein [Argonema antarcticum]MCL1471626.1 hypothetical protein [Argonema antarcticum A004/B2]